MVISRAILRVTPFRALTNYNSTYNLLTKSFAPSSRVQSIKPPMAEGPSLLNVGVRGLRR